MSAIRTQARTKQGLAAAATLLVTMLTSDATATAPDDTIIVTGQKLEKREAQRQARSFVGRTTATRASQYARRTGAVCPRVIGIDARFASIVEAKVRSTSAAVGERAAKPGCAPNMFILFTTDGNGLMALLRKAKPVLFEDVPVSERTALYNDPVPVRWWHALDGKSSEGGISVDSTDAQGIESTTVNRTSSSLLDTGIVIDLTGAVVVVDITKATGYPLESIAAYASMVSMALIKPSPDLGDLPSILGMFAPGKSPEGAPRDLTLFDLAYLTSLYEIQLNREGYLQKNQIAGKMARKLSGE